MNELLPFVLCLAILLGWLFSHNRREDQFNFEREQWHKERQMLLDRIQAPTFAEYTNKVIKEKKLEQPQDEEKRVEFIS